MKILSKRSRKVLSFATIFPLLATAGMVSIPTSALARPGTTTSCSYTGYGFETCNHSSCTKYANGDVRCTYWHTSRFVGYEIPLSYGPGHV